MNFVHLNVHSKASMLYGSADIKAVVAKAKQLGQPAVAITDYSNIYEAINFYRACEKEGVKPILGVDVHFIEDAAEARAHKIRNTLHLTLIAENDTGFQNIARIVSGAHDPDHFFYKPRVDFELLEKYKEGIICLSGSSLDGAISYYLYDKKDASGEVRESEALFRAKALVRRFIKLYGAENFCLEVQDTGHAVQPLINERLRTIARQYGIKTVATGSVHYVEESDAEAHKTLLAMSSNMYTAATSSVFEHEEYYFKSRDEILDTDIEEEEADATLHIAERCNVSIDLKKRRLPKYAFIPEGFTAMEYLRKIVMSNFTAKGFPDVSTGSETYRERLERELTDIEDMGFVDYFLIVHDVIDWVLKQDILVGYGRGSAGGSLVSYCLGITNIDPLEYGLIWERFLNKGRGGLPDIDTDIPRSKRKKVLEYIQKRFGAGNVAQLVTLGGLHARSVLKEVFKVYDMPFDEANAITSLVPAKNDEHAAITLAEAIEKVPELQEYEKKYKPWFAIARALEGCYKTTGIHAAAVVISDKPFEESEYPLTRSKDGNMIFGWDMDTVDSLNLLKLDILGLTTLDDIQVTRELVKQRRGIDLTRETMPLDDPMTYAMLAQGFTVGIFQIERQLGKTWSKNLQPQSIDELSDLVSIIRPGPMECLPGDTQILIDYQKSNQYKFKYISIKDLYDCNYCGKIISVVDTDVHNDDQYTFVGNDAVRVFESGEKKIYKLSCFRHYRELVDRNPTLEIRASANHAFLTLFGYKTLEDLKPYDYVAIMRGRNNFVPKKYTSSNFGKTAFLTYQYKCLCCDWRAASLDVNHIDGNRCVDNTPENLCFLCPNHHRMYTQGQLDRDTLLQYREDFILPHTDEVCFVPVASIEYDGRQMTYDMQVREPYNNFIAGGFVVHNSGMAQSYRGVKMKGEKPQYIHPSLEPILRSTYSGLLYQEQVIEVCRRLAGMSLVDADKVRKAMGKKKPEEMKKWRDVFIDGCTGNGIDAETSESIWGYIENFAGYGFNKSHGVGYALLAYETAYLKANYTIEFLCAKLRHTEGDSEKLVQLVYDAKLFEIEVTPPRVSVGNKAFAIVDDKKIAFGLDALKGVGKMAVTDLVKHTKDCHTVDETLWKLATTKTKVNTGVISALIRGGAFDDRCEHRVRAYARFRLLDALTDLERDTVMKLMIAEPQIDDWVRFVRSLCDEKKLEAIKERYGVKTPNSRRRVRVRELVQEYDSCELFDGRPQRIAWEKHFLGIALSGSEADIYQSRHKCVDLVRTGSPDMAFEVAVCIDSVREILTKKKDPMAFLTVRDDTYLMDNVVVFPHQFAQHKRLLEAGNVIRIRGKIDDRGSLITSGIERLK